MGWRMTQMDGAAFGKERMKYRVSSTERINRFRHRTNRGQLDLMAYSLRLWIQTGSSATALPFDQTVQQSRLCLHKSVLNQQLSTTSRGRSARHHRHQLNGD